MGSQGETDEERQKMQELLRPSQGLTLAEAKKDAEAARIAAIEATLRDASVIEAPVGEAAARVRVGSTVDVEEDDGTTSTFEIVGSTEADPAAGRISNVSPVGRALLGRSEGDLVAVATPRGEVQYRITGLR